jgi:dTDP-glucose pyrophosphorylase/CBS domain-containing protein
MKRLVKELCVLRDRTIHDCLVALNQTAKGILLVVDDDQRLLGTVTDGDIRRAILARVNFESPASELLSRKASSPYPKPVTAPVGTERTALLQLMRKRSVRHVPLLDSAGRVVDLVTLDELLPDQVLPVQAVIMAGGFGKRLRPFTAETPKPMLLVGGRPLMERIVEQLREAGIKQINITTHYKPEKIVDHFGDGSSFGVKLNYVTEARPLGTAGALGLMEKPDKPLLVINGDILTQMNFRAMLTYHQEHKADLTVAVRKYELKVPYGVIENDGVFVQELVEKPSHSFFVNAGIYLLEPSVYHYVPKGQHFDMTHLIQRLLEEKRPVASFPIVEYWLDIGQPADYDQAQEDIQNGSF